MTAHAPAGQRPMRLSFSMIFSSWASSASMASTCCCSTACLTASAVAEAASCSCCFFCCCCCFKALAARTCCRVRRSTRNTLRWGKREVPPAATTRCRRPLLFRRDARACIPAPAALAAAAAFAAASAPLVEGQQSPGVIVSLLIRVTRPRVANLPLFFDAARRHRHVRL
jgi:hypothetical protein